MKVVLLKSVDNLGQAGQPVEVKPGYFRNFLEPRAMALRATPANMRLVESKKKKLESMVAKEMSDAEEIQQKLEGLKLTFKLRAGEAGRLFGSVTARDVMDEIKNVANVEVERRKIEMDNLKTLGEHPVRVRIYPGVAATINVDVERLVPEGEEEGATEEQPVEEEAPAPAAAWVEAPGGDPEDEEESE